LALVVEMSKWRQWGRPPWHWYLWAYVVIPKYHSMLKVMSTCISFISAMHAPEEHLQRTKSPKH
jgi:hypothetical protein